MEHNFPNTHILQSTRELKSLMTIIRCSKTSRSDFIFYSDRIIRMLVEEALNFLPCVPKTVITPTGATYEGLQFAGAICGVSIMRAGEAMEQGLRECCRSVRIGKILIQRDEESAEPMLYYSKLPPDIANRYVLLMDPMLATGGSSKKAIEVLIENGVKEENIILVALIAAPEGLVSVTTAFSKVRIVLGEVDEKLNDKYFICPGLGDFGCRYFGTDK